MSSNFADELSNSNNMQSEGDIMQSEGDAMQSEGDMLSEGDGVDLEDNMAGDYARMEHLDNYEGRDLDNREYDQMGLDERRAAEEEMERREKRVRGYDVMQEDDEDAEADQDREKRRRRLLRDAAEGGVEEGMEEEEPVTLEEFNLPLKEWIATDKARNEIKRRFKLLLQTFTDGNNRNVYEEGIRAMCSANRASLEVSYVHMSTFVPTLAIWLADAPKDMLEIFDEVTTMVALSQFPDYKDIHDEVHVRITELPVNDSLRSLRQVHLNALVKVSGVVTRRSTVFPQLRLVKFNCVKCGHVLGPFHQNTEAEVSVGSCPECQSKGPFMLNHEQTVYRNFQKLTLQESPGSVPAGRVPRHKEIILLDDLIDQARPGEEIEITGIYRHSLDASLNQRQGFPVFSTVIEANHILKREDQFGLNHLTEDDKREIRALAEDPLVGDRIVRSIAPSICGHEHVKTALAMSLFGGRAKNVNNKHRLRGDVNMLLLGDPGTAKSQFLKYAEKTAPRAVYTTGKGASAVGLTAAVHKDPLTREWTLEGGALVLADKGVCLIDEFDKMNEQDRTSIHEAMEQQNISISKAGIITTLQARCAVIAAANPIGGVYDSSRTLAENVELTDPILQRFDVLCVLQDTVDPVADEKLAKFITGSHMRSTAVGGNSGRGAATAASAAAAAENAQQQQAQGIIPQELLKKYIMYARHNVNPILTNLDQDKVARLYADLRRESMTSGGVPIAVRHLESIMRMSEAQARMHLRDHVRADDVDAAIRVMLESFIQAQKFQVMRSLRRGFAKYITNKKDNDLLLLHLLQSLVRDAALYLQLRHNKIADRIEVRCEDLETRARTLGIHDLQAFYGGSVFSDHHFTYDKTRSVVVREF